MNYIKQLSEFYSTIDYKPLSANAIAIYIFLLHIANKTGWIDEFKVANSILMSKCRLNMSALQRARNELITQEYIGYKKGLNQNDAPKYKITKLYFEQADEQADKQADEQADEHINKQNKTKQKKKNIKKEYGEFGNVLLSDEEYQKVQHLFPKDFKTRIQTLDDYIQSKGKKYKDFVATLRNWARKDGYIFPSEKEYKELELTQEEYLKRGKKYE